MKLKSKANFPNLILQLTCFHISAPFYLTCQKSNYDVIFGRDLLLEISPKQFHWLERNQDTHEIHELENENQFCNSRK